MCVPTLHYISTSRNHRIVCSIFGCSFAIDNLTYLESMPAKSLAFFVSETIALKTATIF